MPPSLAPTPAALKARLGEARARVAAALDAGEGGLAVCRMMSRVLDEVVREVSAPVPPGIAIFATGGWGREETCPYSDIDLLFLCATEPDEEARAFAERVLYPLWDSGLEVGHAVRSIGEVAALAREDLATHTSLLDARLVAGDDGLVAPLEGEVRAALSAGGDPNAFIKRLAAEKASRHAKFGDSLYLLEPNVKHGQGGLRDLATGLWAAQARWRVKDFAPLVPLGHASPRQVSALSDARDYLLRVRAAIQLAARRRLDQLTFEIQEAIAPRFFPNARVKDGDVRPAVAPAVEELMRTFYLHARAAVRETDRLLERATVPPQRAPSVWRLEGPFMAFNGQICVEDAGVFRERPAEVIRLFQLALDYKLPILGHTKEVIADLVAADPARLGTDPGARHAFARLLCDPRDDRQPSLLEQMHELGIVAAIMPEFAPCTGRVQHDLYHVYTVDQHQLYAVALLKRIARGELAREAPSPTEASRDVGVPRALYLGTLLHDVGKPLGKGHSEKGAKLAAQIAPRLGFSDEETARTAFLVHHHLLMSHLSQRRDLHDAAMISKFARVVKDVETLRELYLLTYCDASMTSPGNMTEWKAMLLRELYDRTRAHLRRGPDLLAADQSALVKRRKADVEKHFTGDALRQARRWIAGLPDRYFASTTPAEIRLHLGTAVERGDRRVAITVATHRKQSQLVVCAADEPGLLMKIAGVLLVHRVNIVGAKIYSRAAIEPGDRAEVLDVFDVRDRTGKAIPADDPRWAAVEADLAGDPPPPRVAAAGGLPKRKTPAVPTEIEVDNDVSEDFTVVDVYTHDRLGVLFAITRTLAECGLDIGLSKVATEAERVADVFYVRDRETHAKITDPERLRLIAERLRAALAEIPR